MERQAVTDWPAAESREEDSLVSAARDGDRVAFGRLYDRYARMVHGILLARVPPREVDDLVQEVFLSALRQRSEEHTSELQSQSNLVCRLLLEKKKTYRLPRHTDGSNVHARGYRCRRVAPRQVY